MKVSQIREELLEHHRALRVMIGECKKTAREDLRPCLQRLADYLRMHNRREEALLRSIVKRADAWGPARAEIMDEEHVNEHVAIYNALAFFETGDPVKLLDKVLAHMAHEEEVFLNAEVLRDDIVVLDGFGG